MAVNRVRVLVASLIIGASAHAFAQTPAGAASSLPFEHGKVEIEDHTTLAYHIRPGAGPTLVLIPGSWGDYRVFERMVPHLPADYRLVIVELRGHGGSWPPTMHGSMELFADDVLRVVDDLEINHYYVGGHSIGGMVAIEIAGRDPKGLAGVISMEGWTHHEVQADAFGHVQGTTLTPEEEEERLARRARVQDRLTQEQIRSFASIWRTWDGATILESTELPVLEIWGDRAAERPARARLRIPDRPNFTLVWIEGASHSYLIEAPDAVAAAITAFVHEVESGLFRTPHSALVTPAPAM
jgi:pimeloyl-ACP methyl ester carboxylesterase